MNGSEKKKKKKFANANPYTGQKIPKQERD